jgi:hypothetical protein
MSGSFFCITINSWISYGLVFLFLFLPFFCISFCNVTLQKKTQMFHNFSFLKVVPGHKFVCDKRHRKPELWEGFSAATVRRWTLGIPLCPLASKWVKKRVDFSRKLNPSCNLPHTTAISFTLKFLLKLILVAFYPKHFRRWCVLLIADCVNILELDR